MPVPLLGHALAALMQQAMAPIVRRTFKRRAGLWKPSKLRPTPDTSMGLKQC
jgi:hypothetical protein